MSDTQAVYRGLESQTALVRAASETSRRRPRRLPPNKPRSIVIARWGFYIEGFNHTESGLKTKSDSSPAWREPPSTMSIKKPRHKKARLKEVKASSYIPEQDRLMIVKRVCVIESLFTFITSSLEEEYKRQLQAQCCNCALQLVGKPKFSSSRALCVGHQAREI